MDSEKVVATGPTCNAMVALVEQLLLPLPGWPGQTAQAAQGIHLLSISRHGNAADSSSQYTGKIHSSRFRSHTVRWLQKLTYQEEGCNSLDHTF